MIAKPHLDELRSEFDKLLPSDFFLKYVGLFLLKPGAFCNEFEIIVSDRFTSINQLIPKFLDRYCTDSRERLGNQFAGHLLSEIILTEQKAFLEPELEAFLDESVQFITGPGNEPITKLNLLTAFIKGYLLCQELDLTFSKNYLLIELIFVKPQGFDEAFEKIRSTQLSVLTGEPKSGKTYSAYYILYKFNTEENYEIRHCISLNHFSKILHDAKNFFGNKKTLVYFEDPFGFASFDGEFLKEIFDKLKAVSGRENLKIIVSSRKQLFLTGINSDNINQAEVLKNSFIINYKFQKNQLKEGTLDGYNFSSVYYDERKIKKIIQNTAWLYKAKWLRSFSNFLAQSSTPFIWDTLEYSKFSPGNIYESFLIYRSLREFQLKEFDNIRQCLMYGGHDLMNAFNSEVNTFVVREKSFYVKLFFILPAITILQDLESIKNIFGAEFAEVENYLDILKYQNQSPFAKRSLTYYHPIFGEAIDVYLFKFGYKEFLGNDDLQSFINNINEFEEEFIKDLICFIHYLNFIQNTNGSRQFDGVVNYNIPLILKKAQDKINNTKLKNEVRIIEFFYNSIQSNELSKDEKVNAITDFIQKLLNDDIKFTSYVGSVFEHQLFFRSKFLKSNVLPQTISAFIIAVATLIRRKKGGMDLVSSVFLHGIFSNLEELLDYRLKIDENEIFKALKRTIETLGKEYQNGEKSNKLYFLKIIVIWMDAILMKFSELHQYISEGKNIIGNFNYLIKSNNEYYQQEKANLLLKNNIKNCRSLRNQLYDIFIDLWEQTKVDANNNYFLMGAISFSLIWHNRWKYDHGYDDLLDWLSLEKFNTMNSLMADDLFFSGFLYNLQYHYDYFLLRNDAWTRESSIMIWKIENPRKGANAIYESGILVRKDKEGIKIDVEGISEQVVLGTVLHKLIDEQRFGDLRHLVYLIGVRYEKNAYYYESLISEFHEKLILEAKPQVVEVLKNTIIDLEKCQFTLLSGEIDSWLTELQ